jgi:hypothetical protein
MVIWHFLYGFRTDYEWVATISRYLVPCEIHFLCQYSNLVLSTDKNVILGPAPPSRSQGEQGDGHIPFLIWIKNRLFLGHN